MAGTPYKVYCGEIFRRQPWLRHCLSAHKRALAPRAGGTQGTKKPAKRVFCMRLIRSALNFHEVNSMKFFAFMNLVCCASFSIITVTSLAKGFPNVSQKRVSIFSERRAEELRLPEKSAGITPRPEGCGALEKKCSTIPSRAASKISADPSSWTVITPLKVCGGADFVYVVTHLLFRKS